jgi:hypothetical protein
VSLVSLPYTVVRHEVDRDKRSLVRVVLKCLGYPTEGVQPVEWEYALRVPLSELDKFPLGSSVRLTVA